MKTYITTAALIILALLSSCGKRTSQGTEEKQQTREFPMITPPAMMQDAGEIIEYMAMHYWDAFISQPQESGKRYLCDSLHIYGVLKGDLEQGFANYIYILENMPFREFPISTPDEILGVVNEINDDNFKIRFPDDSHHLNI